MNKIIVTVGPKCDNKNSLKEFSKKTNLFRLNGSHGTLDWHRETVDAIRTICPEAFILMDIPGIKPRTSNFEDIFIEKEQEVVFGVPPAIEKRLNIGLTKKIPIHDKNLSYFSLNDGQFVFDVVDFGDGYITGRSRSSFKLLEKKGINLPNSVYDEVHQFEIYQDFLDKVLDIDIDGLGLSFVQTGDLVDQIRNVAPNLVLVAKIENSEGFRNCIEIVNQSDAVMIDRGDLAAEIGFDRLFDSINTISDQTKAHGKPLIMATENLETMVDRERPSKSEVMSIAHSVSIGVDCFMLSEETATAESGQQIVSWLYEFLKTCRSVNKPKASSTVENKFPSIWRSLANLDQQIPIILITKSGYALFEYFSTVPEGEVFLVTNNLNLLKLCDLYANNITVIHKDIGISPTEIIWDLVETNKDLLFKKHNQIAVLYVSKYVNTARANSITIFDRKDFLA
jgi:pyruvate kinase